MNDWYFAAAIGSTLALLGLAMMYAHFRTWQNQRRDQSLDPVLRSHYFSRFRRRMQTSSWIVLLGIMIPIGDSPMMWRQGPLVSTCYWIAVLFVPFWIILLAIGDWLSTRARGKVDLAKVRQKQRELENQIAQFRSRHSNGRH